MGPEVALDRFVRAADARALGLEGVHLVGDGGVELAHRWLDDLRRDVFSASKTVTSLAIGMLVDAGRVDLDDPVLAHLPGLADTAAPGTDQLRVRHLLAMTAGHRYRWTDPDADHPGDPARDILASPLVAAPGTTYDYAGANSYLLGRVVHAVSGLDLRDYLLPRLFEPLGIRNPQWLRCPRGFSLGAVGLQLRTSELTRLAQLLLHGGAHRGTQLVSREYVERMYRETTATGRAEPDNQVYGLHVWRCSRDRAWRLDGIYGQFGIVLPEHRACIGVTAHYRGPTTDILDAVWEHLVPALATG